MYALLFLNFKTQNVASYRYLVSQVKKYANCRQVHFLYFNLMTLHCQFNCTEFKSSFTVV